MTALLSQDATRDRNSSDSPFCRQICGTFWWIPVLRVGAQPRQVSVQFSWGRGGLKLDIFSLLISRFLSGRNPQLSKMTSEAASRRDQQQNDTLIHWPQCPAHQPKHRSNMST